MPEPDKSTIKITKQQRHFLNAVAKYDRVGVKSGHGCHAIDTPIMLYDGTIRKVQHLRVGEYVMGGDGKERNAKKVVRLYRGQEQMYRIKYFDGTYYDVNESHILRLVASQTHGKQKTGEQKNVTVREYLGWSERRRRTNIGIKKRCVFREKRLKIDPYILGVWLGDGHSNNTVITNIDHETIDAWKNEAEKRGLRFRKFDKLGWKMAGKTGAANSLKSDLKRYDLIENKHIPFHYKTSTIKDKLELLAGIIDTDGTLDRRDKRTFTITIKLKTLADDIRFVAQTAGCHATVNEVWKMATNGRFKKKKKYYSVVITRNVQKIPCRLPRKKAIKIPNPQRNNLHYGFTVEPLSMGDYYGFEVGGDGLYMLGDCTVTHNTGKSSCLSWLVLWFLFTRRSPCKIPCTAPTYHQLTDVLWPEVSRWLMTSDLVEMMHWTNDRVYEDKFREDKFAVARSVAQGKSSNLSGFHAFHMMFIVDEGFGILDPMVWEVIEGAMTQHDNKLVFAGNPTMVTGYCFEAFKDPGKEWQEPKGKVLTMNSEESPLVVPEKCEQMAAKYGKHSDVYRVRILGEFPLGNPEAFLQLTDLEAARMRVIEGGPELEIGSDIARFGDDMTVVTIRYGNHVFPQKLKGGRTKTDESAEFIIQAVREYRKKLKYDARIRIKNDDTGVGGAVSDILEMDKYKEDNIEVVRINFAVGGNETYANITSIMWGQIRDKLPYIQLPDDQTLIDELGSRKFDLDSKGRIRIQPKADFKKEISNSPDRSDSLILAFADNISEKRVFSGYDDHNEEHHKDFKIDWYGATNIATLNYGAVHQGKDLSLSHLCALWHGTKMKLFVYEELVSDDPFLYSVIPELKLMLHFDTHPPEKVIGSPDMFSLDLTEETTSKVYKRHGLRIRQPWRYDERGAISLTAHMFSQDMIMVHSNCKELHRQLSGWIVHRSNRLARVEAKPMQGDSGLCRALVLIVSEVRRHVEEVLAPPRDRRAYHKEDQPHAAIPTSKRDGWMGT